jgi:hypothetical protein
VIKKIRKKLRNLIEDNSKSDSETFVWTSGDTLTLATDNVDSITKITVNGIETTNYTYDSSSQTVTFNSGEVSANDTVIVYFNYYKYSNTELVGYIKSALNYLDIYQYSPHFEVVSGDEEIYPIPTLEEISLIAMVASILIKPNWSRYSLGAGGITVQFPRTRDKDTKIKAVINSFKRSSGIIGILNL